MVLICQGALVLLPVLVLSAIAFYFLREDKASIQSEARDRAQQIAPGIARDIGRRAAEILAREPIEAQGAIVNGRIQSPPDSDAVPVPPDWPDRLSPGEARLWRRAQEAIYERGDLEGARGDLTQLARLAGSPEARANAELGLLLLDAGRTAAPALARRYTDVAHRYPKTPTESGSSLAAVALLSAVRLSGKGPLPEALLAEIARHVQQSPSFLTAQVIDEAGKAAGPDGLKALGEGWSRHERTLALLRLLLRAPPAAGVPIKAWLDLDGHAFLGIGAPAPGGWHVVFLPAAQIERAFREAISSSQQPLPPYAGAGARLAGRQWALTGARRGPAQTLASAGWSLAIGGADTTPFTLDIEADPSTLYARYQQRFRLVGGLIFSAAIAAFLGLFTIWQSFQRQRRLAEMKTNFVSAVSHELRAPIGAVRLMAESLERGKITDPAKQKDYFRLIVQECRRLSSMVENVLDFSRMDSGRKQYRFEAAALTPLLRDAAALMEPVAAERGVQLVVVPPVADLQPCWDAQAVQQALVNLLDNAIKHSPRGAEVRLESEAGGANLRIWVTDSGEGIPPEARSRIFDLFYRHGSELRRETKGAGIGLSIVKHVAEAHGGRVLVESEAGQGSRFGLELPA